MEFLSLKSSNKPEIKQAKICKETQSTLSARNSCYEFFLYFAVEHNNRKVAGLLLAIEAVAVELSEYPKVI